MLSFLAAILVTVVGVSHCAAYLLWHYERCRSGACGARLAGADVGPWLAEGLALLVAVLTWPLGLAGWTRAARAGVGRPVVLVHGWGLNRASMALIAARLRRDGRIVHAEAFTWRRKNLADAAASVAERLRAAAAASGSRTVDVVAYGVGGVLVRLAAQAHGASPLLGNVVTLASPHRGTALALLGLPAIRDLRPGSSFLDDLVRGEKLPTQTHVAAIASPFDAVVFPFDLAYWPGAFNVTVERVGHCSMLYSERVYTLIAENVNVAPRIAAA